MIDHIFVSRQPAEQGPDPTASLHEIEPRTNDVK